MGEMRISKFIKLSVFKKITTELMKHIKKKKKLFVSIKFPRKLLWWIFTLKKPEENKHKLGDYTDLRRITESIK